ncbi:hypothetical protein [Amycolatopsis magusensis]|uniref:hypothetical protein n=1 Tax=Amycolatopsis magusensis TaxID=882444 RepID=UPI003C2C827F
MPTAFEPIEPAWRKVTEAVPARGGVTGPERVGLRISPGDPFTPDGPTAATAPALIEQDLAEVISFGTLFLADPDLPARLAGGGDRGCTDYPALTEETAR